MRTFLLLTFLACSSLASSPLAAQATRRYTTLVPYVAGGGADHYGPMIYAGLQLRRELTDAVVVVLQGARSASAVACADEFVEGRPQCGSSGTDVDAGMNVQANTEGFARPYAGIGAGIVGLGDFSAPSVNVRAGVALGARWGFSLMLEARTQRVFGDIDAAAGRVSIGLGLGF